jgi:hypothetical protein
LGTGLTTSTGPPVPATATQSGLVAVPAPVAVAVAVPIPSLRGHDGDPDSTPGPDPITVGTPGEARSSPDRLSTAVVKRRPRFTSLTDDGAGAVVAARPTVDGVARRDGPDGTPLPGRRSRLGPTATATIPTGPFRHSR